MITRIKELLKRLVLEERSPRILAISFCVGIYIAFSPFIGLHTVMVFIFSWLLGLNFATVFAASNFINNPWTMVPVYTSGHVFGDFLFSRVCGWPQGCSNPAWMARMSNWLSGYVDISGFSLWAFMIGGNLLGLIFALAMYPFMSRVFHMLVAEVEHLMQKRKEKSATINPATLVENVRFDATFNPNNGQAMHKDQSMNAADKQERA